MTETTRVKLLESIQVGDLKFEIKDISRSPLEDCDIEIKFFITNTSDKDRIIEGISNPLQIVVEGKDYTADAEVFYYLSSGNLYAIYFDFAIPKTRFPIQELTLKLSDEDNFELIRISPPGFPECPEYCEDDPDCGSVKCEKCGNCPCAFCACKATHEDNGVK